MKNQLKQVSGLVREYYDDCSEYSYSATLDLATGKLTSSDGIKYNPFGGKPCSIYFMITDDVDNGAYKSEQEYCVCPVCKNHILIFDNDDKSIAEIVCFDKKCSSK